VAIESHWRTRHNLGGRERLCSTAPRVHSAITLQLPIISPGEPNRELRTCLLTRPDRCQANRIDLMPAPGVWTPRSVGPLYTRSIGPAIPQAYYCPEHIPSDPPPPRVKKNWETKVVHGKGGKWKVDSHVTSWAAPVGRRAASSRLNGKSRFAKQNVCSILLYHRFGLHVQNYVELGEIGEIPAVDERGF
jgi:hypothetical protein